MSVRVGRFRLSTLLPAIGPIAAVGVAITFFSTTGAGAAEEPFPLTSATAKSQLANAPFEYEPSNRPRNVPTPTPSEASSPTATPSSGASPTPETSSTPAPGTCSVAYRVINSWGQGFQANVTLHNTGTAPVTDWRLTWRNPSGVRITNSWNGILRVSGDEVTVTSASWNATIAPGSAVTIGYTAATETAPADQAEPVDFRLGGALCTRA